MNNDETYNASEDKTSPEYWDFYYDARYCGPSREAYVGEMVSRYRNANYDPAFSSGLQGTEVDTSLCVSEELREKADREQQAVEREGLRPDYHRFSNGMHTCGVVNRNCDVIVSYDRYSNIGFYHNGLARVYNRKTNKFGFIDRHGNEVIPCIWSSAGEFSQYLAGVKDESEECGYVDVTGKLVIPCDWAESWPFQEGLARVQDYRGMIGMINQRGEEVIPCIWYGMGDFSEGLAGVKNEEGKCGFVDRTGSLVISCRWKNVWTFCEGLAVVQNFNERLGYINKKGYLVIPCCWKKANFFKDGFAKVSKSKTIFLKDKWVYIDKEGRIVK